MSYDFDQEPRGMTSGAKMAIGCGAAAFLCMALMCGGFVLLGFRAVDKFEEVAVDVRETLKQQGELLHGADEFAARFVAQGYERVDGQAMEITSTIKQPTVYTVQVLNLNVDSEASIAVNGLVVDITGTINGDLHVRCHVLNIHPDTMITGNLYIEQANVVENEGTVLGEVVHAPADTDGEPEEPGDATSSVPELKPSPGDVIEKDQVEKKDATEKAPQDDGTSTEPSADDPPAKTPDE